MSQSPKPTTNASKAKVNLKPLHAEYKKLATSSGIEAKPLSQFKDELALQSAIKFLKEGQEKKDPKAKPLKVAGNYVKLSPADRTKLRRLAKDGKVQHPWGGKWELTKADYDRLMGSAASN